MVIFYNGEQEKLKDITKTTKLETKINLLLKIGGKTLCQKKYIRRNFVHSNNMIMTIDATSVQINYFYNHNWVSLMCNFSHKCV